MSGGSFPRHSHDQFGIGVMVSGAQRSWSCVGSVESGPGDLVMVNPGEMHDGLPLGDEPRRWHVLYLDPELVARELDDEGLAGPDGAPEIAPTARDPALAGRVLALFEALCGRPDALQIEERLLDVLVGTIRRHGLGRRTVDADLGRSPQVRRALRRIEEAPEQGPSLQELADLSGVSRFQLLRGFAREVGATPHAYLIQRRLLLVRRLLATGHSPAEAALLSGFADQSHMTRAFGRQFGVTPARYRAALA